MKIDREILLKKFRLKCSYLSYILIYFYIFFAERTKEVINLKEEIGTEWISLSWEPPCEVSIPTKVSITYSVERCDYDKNCNITNEHNTWHNATNLDACTYYTFVVKIITDNWESIGVHLQLSTNDTSKYIDSYWIYRLTRSKFNWNWSIQKSFFLYLCDMTLSNIRVSIKNISILISLLIFLLIK